MCSDDALLEVPNYIMSVIPGGVPKMRFIIVQMHAYISHATAPLRRFP